MADDSTAEIRPDGALRLAKAREQRGFADAKSAANFFGWKYSTYSQHERGERGLRPDVAARYASALRVSLAWLLTGEGEMAPDAAAAERRDPRPSFDEETPPGSKKRGSLGPFIREWREARGMTLDQMARLLGDTDADKLSAFERKQTGHDRSTLKRIAQELNTDSASLLGIPPPDEEPIWRIWQRANPHQRQQILEISKTITKGGSDR